MMTEQEIVAKLQRIGFTDDEVPRVMRDVGSVIVEKVLATYLAGLSDDERTQIESATPEEAQRFLSEHNPPLQPLSQTQFDAIHNGTWQEYFRSVR
jgi:hypothetical protein